MKTLNIELFLICLYLIYLLFRSDPPCHYVLAILTVLALKAFIRPLKTGLSDELWGYCSEKTEAS
jgi:hypothetical protein